MELRLCGRPGRQITAREISVGTAFGPGGITRYPEILRYFNRIQDEAPKQLWLGCITLTTFGPDERSIIVAKGWIDRESRNAQIDHDSGFFRIRSTGVGAVLNPKAKEGWHALAGENGDAQMELMTDLQDAVSRADQAEAATVKLRAVLRQAEQLLQRLHIEREEAVTRARIANQRAAEAEQGLNQMRELVAADRVELEAAILRASEAMGEIEESRRRAEDAEWRAVRAEARIEQMFKAAHGQASAERQAEANAAPRA